MFDKSSLEKFRVPSILAHPMSKALRYACPTCGNEVVVGKPCPHCANQAQPKKARKSWEQDSSADGLDLPDDDFNYDEFVAREFGKTPHRKLGVPWYWWLLGIGILITL